MRLRRIPDSTYLSSLLLVADDGINTNGSDTENIRIEINNGSPT